MDPVQPPHTPIDQAHQNGQPIPTAPDSGAAGEQIPAAPRQPGEPDALRLAREAQVIAGGLVARVDQIETKVVRVDRQVLMLIGMVAVIAWGVKALGVKVESIEGAIVDGATAAS